MTGHSGDKSVETETMRLGMPWGDFPGSPVTSPFGSPACHHLRRGEVMK